MIKLNLKRNHIILICGLYFMLLGNKVSAQLEPLFSQYYSNRYLANPAMAGLEQRVRLNTAFRQSWTRFPGSPAVQQISADKGLGKMAAGLNLSSETAGLLRQFSAFGTFAYHLPLNARGDHLHFGLSGGLLNRSVNQNMVVGDVNDEVIPIYNNRPTTFDADFGMAYTRGGLTAQLSLNNMMYLFSNHTVRNIDQSTFYLATSYRFAPGTKNAVVLEPLAALRGIRGLDPIFDIGIQSAVLNEQLAFTALYSTSNVLNFNIGYTYKQKYTLNFTYGTSTSSLSSYNGGNFEFGLRAVPW